MKRKTRRGGMFGDGEGCTEGTHIQAWEFRRRKTGGKGRAEGINPNSKQSGACGETVGENSNI